MDACLDFTRGEMCIVPRAETVQGIVSGRGKHQFGRENRKTARAGGEARTAAPLSSVDRLVERRASPRLAMLTAWPVIAVDVPDRLCEDTDGLYPSPGCPASLPPALGPLRIRLPGTGAIRSASKREGSAMAGRLHEIAPAHCGFTSACSGPPQ